MKEKTSLVLLGLLLMAVPLYAGQAADFSFTGLDGKVYASADLKGTAVVINIGSHW